MADVEQSEEAEVKDMPEVPGSTIVSDAEMSEESSNPDMMDSTIVKDPKDYTRLHTWLADDKADGAFELLYRSTRDGIAAKEFHSRCDNKGATLTIIEIFDGRVVGGYTNKDWKSTKFHGLTWYFEEAKKSFIFSLPGAKNSIPLKLKLKDRDDGHAIRQHPEWGPTFGRDLRVRSLFEKVHNMPGQFYEESSMWPLEKDMYFQIKEMEVFKVVKPGGFRNGKPWC